MLHLLLRLCSFNKILVVWFWRYIGGRWRHLF